MRGEPFENGVPVDLALSSPGAVATTASQVGAGNALIVVPGPGPAWVRDATPSSHLAGVRFGLRTADINLGSGSRVKVLDFGSSDTGGTSVTALWLDLGSNGHTLTLEARNDDGTITTSAPTVIDSQGETVDLLWEAATGATASNGRATFSIAGVEKVRLGCLDTVQQTVESVTLGAAATIGSVSGSVMIDVLIIVEAP